VRKSQSPMSQGTQPREMFSETESNMRFWSWTENPIVLVVGGALIACDMLSSKTVTTFTMVTGLGSG
jgi:hypothetical protein